MTEREHMSRYESKEGREKREKQEVKKIGRDMAKKIIRDAKKASGFYKNIHRRTEKELDDAIEDAERHLEVGKGEKMKETLTFELNIKCNKCKKTVPFKITNAALVRVLKKAGVWEAIHKHCGLFRCERGDSMKKVSTFVLDKDTVIMCLYEIMSTAFCSYVGDKEKLRDTSEFSDADLLQITEEDWRDIDLTWNTVEPLKNSYYEILNQAPEEWFKEEKPR